MTSSCIAFTADYGLSSNLNCFILSLKFPSFLDHRRTSVGNFFPVQLSYNPQCSSSVGRARCSYRRGRRFESLLHYLPIYKRGEYSLIGKASVCGTEFLSSSLSSYLRVFNELYFDLRLADNNDSYSLSYWFNSFQIATALMLER